MLSILVKTIVNTNNNTLAKSIADTNTSTFYCFYIQQRSFYSAINKVNKMIIVEKMAKLL